MGKARKTLPKGATSAKLKGRTARAGRKYPSGVESGSRLIGAVSSGTVRNPVQWWQLPALTVLRNGRASVRRCGGGMAGERARKRQRERTRGGGRKEGTDVRRVARGVAGGVAEAGRGVGGGRQGRRASMPQNVDRERRVPHPFALTHTGSPRGRVRGRISPIAP